MLYIFISKVVNIIIFRSCTGERWPANFIIFMNGNKSNILWIQYEQQGYSHKPQGLS